MGVWVAKAIAFVILTLGMLLLRPFRPVPYIVCHYELTKAAGIPFGTRLIDTCGMMIPLPWYKDPLPDLIAAPFFAVCLWVVTGTVWAKAKGWMN